MNLDFRGEVAVVTGDARGIGEATARKLAAFRASVVILDVVSIGNGVSRAIDVVVEQYRMIDILESNGERQR
jgi:3-oxoacyl-[acyl-carrier protein] reductase